MAGQRHRTTRTSTTTLTITEPVRGVASSSFN